MGQKENIQAEMAPFTYARYAALKAAHDEAFKLEMQPENMQRYRSIKNWFSIISKELEQAGESWGDVVACTLSDEEMLKKFQNGYYWERSGHFTVWTDNRVYYSLEEDGCWWVESVLRNPPESIQPLEVLEFEHAEEAGAEVQARAWDQLVSLTETDNASSKGGAA